MAHLQLSQTLADSFTALADEVQSLTDRKTVLEHKLRFAHEQVSIPHPFVFLAPLAYPCLPFHALFMMSYLSSRSRAVGYGLNCRD